jgi:hypothetical protein
MKEEEYMVVISEHTGSFDAPHDWHVLAIFPVSTMFHYDIPEADADRPNLQVSFVRRDILGANLGLECHCGCKIKGKGDKS